MTFYRSMYFVGFALMMLVSLLTCKKYKFTKDKAVIFTLITYACGIIGATIMGYVYSWVMRINGFPGESNVAIFGAVIFTPLFVSIIAFIMKENWRRMLDVLTPGIYIILACAKFGCFVEGCCHGIVCDWGVYNERVDSTVFPIQIIEVAFMILIISFCFYYSLKSPKHISGTVYPVTSILYCFVRFFVEFLRYYEVEGQRHVMFGVTLWQFCCVVVATISIIWIVLAKKREKKKLLQEQQ